MRLPNRHGESNVYQWTVDYPDEWNNGSHVMLNNEVLVTATEVSNSVAMATNNGANTSTTQSLW